MAKTALITGGTGSFGQTMVRHLLGQGYDRVRILSRDEEKQHVLRSELSDPRLECVIGDVRDAASVDSAVAGVGSVFHAAALKQVPSCEFFPIEAMKTNVIGSQNVIECAARAGVARCVLLSTDKAVQPVNAMGMTKGLMEKLVAAKAREKGDWPTIFSIVRYGNVMGSRGSVIPLFVNLLLQQKPMTVTDPEMTRFLLPLDDAVELVDHAFAHAKQGDTFIRKAKATSVGTLARALGELFESTKRIKIIGERHGEKLFETLATAAELSRSEDRGNFFRIPVDTRSLNYAAFFDEGHKIKDHSDYSSHTVKQLDVEETKALLQKLPLVRDALRSAGITQPKQD